MKNLLLFPKGQFIREKIMILLEKRLSIWTKFTYQDNVKQAQAIAMSLFRKALDAILELSDDDIWSKDGIKLILEKLATTYKKDELREKFQYLENF